MVTDQIDSFLVCPQLFLRVHGKNKKSPCLSTKVLNFIKRNLYNCPPNTKRIAYLTLVRPIMEYATSVWDPYYNTDINKLEKVQRRAARWILLELLVLHQCYHL